MEIHARNVNDGFAQALHLLVKEGEKAHSRNGDVVVLPEPIIISYSHPWERVLFSPMRNANPFFHLMESLWMLRGRNDLRWPAYFNSRFSQYSDDNVKLHGAYGHRWRLWFDVDQLAVIIDTLKKDAESRRCVLQIWSAKGDLVSHDGEGGPASRDLPCNTQVYFSIRNRQLHMTVCNRSNDVIWGAFGANAVHFSILMEYMAAMIGVPMGIYTQFSNNLHLYPETLAAMGCDARTLAANVLRTDRYIFDTHSYPLIADTTTWDRELQLFLVDPLQKMVCSNPFFTDVAQPVYAAWRKRKERLGSGLDEAASIKAEDWLVACVDWITRKEAQHGR